MQTNYEAVIFKLQHKALAFFNEESCLYMPDVKVCNFKYKTAFWLACAMHELSSVFKIIANRTVLAA